MYVATWERYFFAFFEECIGYLSKVSFYLLSVDVTCNIIRLKLEDYTHAKTSVFR